MGTPSAEIIATIIDHLRKIVDDHKVDVPVLPETAHRVMMLTQDPESDAAQLAAIIQSDPTLGGHVMRIANSAAYTPNSNLVSIQQAIARLGMIEISNIALSTSLNSKMFNAPGYEKHIAVIWQHALATALWSKEVARAIRSNVEAAFLCGLLHSVGKPVILQSIADYQSDPPLTPEALQQCFSEFETDYAKAVANEWELPSIVAEAIVFYQHFDDAPMDKELAAIVAYGCQLATYMLQREQTDVTAVTDSTALDILNLYPDQVQKLLQQEEQVNAAMDILSL